MINGLILTHNLIVCLNLVGVRTTLEDGFSWKRKPFKFMNVLTMIPQFTSRVEEYWETTTPLFISTMFRFSKN